MSMERPERQFEGSDDELVAALGAALRPTPLPPAVVRRIQTDFDHRCRGARRSRLPALRVASLATAAGIIVALLAPQPPMWSADRLAPVALTSNEAAQIVAAFSTLNWDSPAASALDLVDDSLDELGRVLRREDDGATLLPWGSEDDWDLPVAVEEDSSRGSAPIGSWCQSECRFQQRSFALSVAAAPRGGRRSSIGFHTPTAATGGGRYDGEPALFRPDRQEV